MSWKKLMTEITHFRIIWTTLVMLVTGIILAGDAHWVTKADAEESHARIVTTLQAQRVADLIFQLRTAISDLDIQIGYVDDSRERQMLRARIKVLEGRIRTIKDSAEYDE